MKGSRYQIPVDSPSGLTFWQRVYGEITIDKGVEEAGKIRERLVAIELEEAGKIRAEYAELRELAEKALETLQRVSGGSDSDDACIRVACRILAEALGKELSLYRLLKEPSPTKPLYRKSVSDETIKGDKPTCG